MTATKAAVFDLFGTLIHMYDFESYYKTLHEMSKILDIETEPFIDHWRTTFEDRMKGAYRQHEDTILEVLQKLSVKKNEETIRKAAEAKREYVRSTITPREDAEPTINHFAEKDIKLGLITDCNFDIPDEFWKSFPFSKHFHVEIFSCCEGTKKPDPILFKKAIDGLGVSPEETLYVGDGGSHELTAASKAGMQPILIRVPGEGQYDQFRPDAQGWQGTEVSSLWDLTKLI